MREDYLIANTTRAQRERIVEESLGIYAGCDGCASGIAEMYQPYIDGKMELSECTMSFNARYVKDMDMEVRGGSCPM